MLFSQFFLCPLFDTKGSVAYYLGVQTAVDVLADKQDGETLMPIRKDSLQIYCHKKEHPNCLSILNQIKVKTADLIAASTQPRFLYEEHLDH